MAKSTQRKSMVAILGEKAATPATAAPSAGAPAVQEVKDKGDKPAHVSVYLPREVHEQLRLLAFTEKTSQNKLIAEGLDLLFSGRALPSIAELTADAKK